MLSPQLFGILVVVLILIGVVITAIRRRRASNNTEVTAPLDIGEPVDYTSIPYEEPTTLADRFRNAPPALKVLAILIPLLLIGGLIALALALGQSGPGKTVDVPPPPLNTVIDRAVVAGNGKITISGTTDAPNDAVITATMLESGQPFAWFDAGLARVNPSNGRFTFSLDRVDGAPIPQKANEYSVVVTTSAAGHEASSEAKLVEVSAPYAADFFQTVAVVPTATPKPEATPAPTVAPRATAVVPTASVRTAGRIRSQPSKDASEVGGISVGEVLTVVARTEDSSWYQVKGAEGEGWVSAALIEIKPDIAAKVSTPAAASQITTTVFNGGNVRPGPGVSFTPALDQINAGETVQLLGKSDDGNWYKIVNKRSVTGWVSRTLLNLTPELIAKVSVAKPEDDTAASTSPPATGLTAKVFNGGNVRTGPGIANGVVEQINAGETVQLLAKNSAGSWIKITTPRKTTGWVSVTLLTIDSATLGKVPVE